MPNRIAGILALIAFATCLLLGAFQAENSFTTTVFRGLLAMLGTYLIGYCVGIAAEKMLVREYRRPRATLGRGKKKRPEE